MDVILFVEVIEYVDLECLGVFECVVFYLVVLCFVVMIIFNKEFNLIFENMMLGLLWYKDYCFEWMCKEFEDWFCGVCE